MCGIFGCGERLVKGQGLYVLAPRCWENNIFHHTRSNMPATNVLKMHFATLYLHVGLWENRRFFYAANAHYERLDL